MNRLTPSQYTTDNRDISETWLHTPEGLTIEVRPADLVRNVLENLPEEVSKKYLNRFNQLFDDLEGAIEDLSNPIKTSYQIHVIMFEVKRPPNDPNGDEASYDIMHEEEPKDYREEFRDYDEAKKVYQELTGIAID
jgi:hypothetical protein